MNQTLPKRVIARYQSKHTPQTSTHRSLTPVKLAIVISRLYLLRESSYRNWNFWYVCTEECVNEDAKKEEKEKEKKRTLSVCCDRW